MLSSRSKHTNLKIETLLCRPIIGNGDKETSSIATTAITGNSNLDLPFFHLPLPLQTTAITPFTQHSGSFLAVKSSSALPRDSSGILEGCALPFAYNRTVKAKRKRASPWQTAALEQVFKQTEFPSSSIRSELGLRLGMTPRTIQIWFQNKRQATKRSTTTAATAIRDDDFHAGYQDHRHLHYYRQQQHQQFYIATP